MSTRGTEDLARDLARQRVLLMGNRNEPYRRALEHLSALLEGPHADAAILAKLDRCWRERSFSAYYERPLLLLAAMRHEALADGPRHPLARGFATVAPSPDAVTREAVRAALAPDRFSLWVTLTTRRVQTNEVSRAVTWRWPARLSGCDGGARPLALVDIGAAAGLNLIGDRLPGTWSDSTGARLEVVTSPRVVARYGFDSAPLDVRYEEDLAWMRACIWPGETERFARFEEAVRVMRDAYEKDETRPELIALNAGVVAPRLEVLARKLDAEEPGTLVLAYQTFVRGYFEPERARTYARGMRSWLAGRPPRTALWCEMEMADDDGGGGDAPAELLVHARTRPDQDVQTFRLARCSYHPATLRVDAHAVAAFSREFRG